MIFPTSNAAGLIRYYAGFMQLSMDVLLFRWLILAATVIVSIIIVSSKARWRET
ncbi:MAG: hypothetical protein WBV70_01580 [Candidatus Bathyarchaeia archaeon]